MITTENPGNRKRDSHTAHWKTDFATRKPSWSPGCQEKHPWHFSLQNAKRKVELLRGRWSVERHSQSMGSPLPSQSSILLYLKPYNFYLNRAFLKLAQKATKSTEGEIKVPSWSSHKVSRECEFPPQKWRKARDTQHLHKPQIKRTVEVPWHLQTVLKICCSGDFYPVNYSKGLLQKKEKKAQAPYSETAPAQQLTMSLPTVTNTWGQPSYNQLAYWKHPHPCCLKIREKCPQPPNHGLSIICQNELF